MAPAIFFPYPFLGFPEKRERYEGSPWEWRMLDNRNARIKEARPAPGGPGRPSQRQGIESRFKRRFLV